MKFLDKIRAMKDEAMERLQATKDDSPPSERKVKKYSAEGKPVNE